MSRAFEKIDALKAQWEALQPLSPENERRLWLKLRLEWNYHSNHIEGNTLTYGETVLLLLHGQTQGNHLLREYEEMKAHDVGIAHLRSLAEDPCRLISPSEIRDLNRIILKEPFWKPTRTSDGQPTRSQVIPGEYKTLPNSVITATGELFEYAAPIDVPIRMQALVDWLAAALEDGSAHLVQIAARLHHDFVLIHPFDDGNGRVARMLVNYLLLREGYPPLIVPTEKKSVYLTALRLADAGDLGPLADFLAEEVECSLKLGIRAAKGESIEESGDVEKQVALFVRSEKAQREREVAPSVETLRSLAETTLVPFIRELERKLSSLRPVFGRYEVATTTSKGASSPSEQVGYHLFEFPPVNGWVRLCFRFLGYKGSSKTPFDLKTEVEIRFTSAGYTIAQDGRVILSRDGFLPLPAAEIDQLTASILSHSFEEVRFGAAKAD